MSLCDSPHHVREAEDNAFARLSTSSKGVPRSGKFEPREPGPLLRQGANSNIDITPTDIISCGHRWKGCGAMEVTSKEPEIRYKHVEAVLSRIFKVSPANRGAFRARLRHLRNMGIPDLPRPGSGAQIRYTRVHLIQMIIALELSALGIAPRHAADLAESVRPADSTNSEEGLECHAIDRLFTPGLGRLEATSDPFVMSVTHRNDDGGRFGAKGDTFLIVYPGSEFAAAGNYNVEIKELNRFEIAAQVFSNPRISFVNLTPSIKVLDEYLDNLG
jgi:hypothetical protein